MITIISPPEPTDSLSTTASAAHFVPGGLQLTSDPFPARVRGEYREVDSHMEVPWLQAILKHLPALLPELGQADWHQTLERLAQLTYRADWRAERDIEFSINGHQVTETFLRTVPLLTEQEVRDQMAPIPGETWATLMKLIYNHQTLYFADQFASDGTLIPVCRQLMDIFKADPDMTDWDIAIWWISATGWLSDACPRQVYLEEVDAVIHAAEQHIADE